MATSSPVSTLDRDRVVDAALALADREGVGALSMRRVAAELGAGTMSLYHHVADKADLERLVLERVLAEVEYRPGADVVAAARELAQGVRSAFLAHPATIRLLGAGLRPEPMLRGLTAAYDGLASRGVDPTTALQMIGVVSRYVIGSLLAELFGPAAASSREERDRDFDFGLEAVFSGLSQVVQGRQER